MSNTMIDWSFMSGGGQQGSANQTQTLQQMQAMQPQGVQPGPLASIPNGAVTPQNSAALADALMAGAPNPVDAANNTKPGIFDKFGGNKGASFMLASIGSALSAKDPTSWQHQLSGVVAKGAQNQMMQRGALIAALQQKIGASTPGSSLPQKKFSLSKAPNLSLLPSGGGIDYGSL